MIIPDDATLQELINERDRRLYEVGINDPSLTIDEKIAAAEEIARKMDEVRELQCRITASEKSNAHGPKGEKRAADGLAIAERIRHLVKSGSAKHRIV